MHTDGTEARNSGYAAAGVISYYSSSIANLSRTSPVRPSSPRESELRVALCVSEGTGSRVHWR